MTRQYKKGKIMKLKKSVSLILSIAMLLAALPTISFAETNETPEVTYSQERATVENFNPEATQEPFSNPPTSHTEVVPDTVRMEEFNGIELETTITATDIIENVMPDGASPDAVLSTTSTSNADLWNSIMSTRFGDNYLLHYKKNDGQTVSGQTNRLTIRETDLSLPGKNGLDVNIRRYHDNQFYRTAFSGTQLSEFDGVHNYFYIYRFIDSRNNYPVYIAFFTQDDFYYYNMDRGITITKYPTSSGASFQQTIDGSSQTCYYFSEIYSKKNSEGTITLTYDETFSPLWKSKYYSQSARNVLFTYDLLPDSGGLGYYWMFEMPEASMQAYSYLKIDHSTYNEYEYDYVGAFRDIDGVVHQFNGYGTLREPDEGENTYTSSIYSNTNRFLTATQYFAPQTLGETDIVYNFTIFDNSKRLTYYMYNIDVTSDSINKSQQIYVVAVADEFGNMIQYKYSSGYNDITQIIDTYGRTINFTDIENGKQISYTDENGVVQTIKYEKEVLSPTELQNGSPIVEKEVHRFKVTNEQNETTIYDSREGESLAYYYNASGMFSVKHSCFFGDYIEPLSCDNIERIIYPNGAEKRYKYRRYYTSNKESRIAYGSYFVTESYDVINNVEKNKETYAFAVEDLMIEKTGTNSSSGLVTVHNYDIDGMLTQTIASATGAETGAYVKNSYTYGTNNQVTQHIINNSGISRINKYSYENNYTGMIKSVEESGKTKTTYTYHTVNDKATLIPSITNVYKYSNSDFVLDYSIQTTLDSTNRAVEYEKVIKDNVIESQTKYVRDDNGRVISVMQWTDDTNGDGALDTNDSVITTNTQYTENGDGSVTVTETNGGVSATYRFGVTGLPYSMTDPNGNTTQVQYDNVGRAKKYIYPNGATETADYNITSMFTNVKDKAGEYTWTYFNQSGLPTSKFFSNSQWTQFESNQYDNADRLTYKKSIYDVDKFTAERYTYDVLDRVTSKQVYDNETLLYTENYTYTTNKTTKATTAEDGTSVATERQTVDSYGRVTKKEVYSGDTNLVTSYTYDSYDNVLTETDPMGNVTTYTYDIFNNVTSITYPDNSVEYMYYDMLGRNVTNIDKNSTEYRNIYDNLGRVTETQVKVNDTYVTLTTSYYDNNSNLTTKCININPQSDTGIMRDTHISYVYDNMNNLVVVSEDDGNDGQCTQYWYDVAGRMTKMATGLWRIYEESALPDTEQIIQYGYDIHGNMTSKTDQLGNVTTYTYDYVGNVKSETLGNVTINKTYGPYGMTASYTDNDVSYDDYTYTYNNMGMMSTHTSTYLDGMQHTETIGYDAFGRKTTETSNGRTHLYSYDSNSRVTNYQMKNDTVVENDIDYTYDNMGRTTLMEVNDVTVNGTTITGADISYTYDVSGNLTSKVQGTNRTDITYNQFNQPTVYTNWINNRVLSSHEYAYNWKGNILSDIDQVSSYDRFYTYNAWDDLVSEKYTYMGGVTKQINYTYDRASNRISMTVTGDENYTKTYTYNKRNQLLTETKTENDETTEVISYDYTARGQRGGKYRTVDGVTSIVAFYAWDANGHLLQYDPGSPTAMYSYDALGRRTEKYTNNTIDFTWSGDQEMATINTNGVTTDRYIYGIDGIAMTDSLYYFKNAHGDVTNIVNKNGVSVGTYKYEAFGVKLASPTNDTNPFQYCGEYYDDESGLIYLRNRYYDPSIGAFISEDPIQDGMNWYTYCGNNPVNFVDPLGLKMTLIGTGDEVNLIWENLKKLSDDELVLTQNRIQVAEGVYQLQDSYTVTVGTQVDGSHPVGTSMVRRIVDNDYTCYIQLTDGANVTKYIYEDDSLNPAIGSGARVFINPDAVISKVYTEHYDQRGYRTVVYEKAPLEITIGHELIHALRGMGGNRIYYNDDNNQGYGRYTYREKDGTMKSDSYRMEELATTGISYIRPDGTWADAANWFTTENSLRKECGYGRRVKY